MDRTGRGRAAERGVAALSAWLLATLAGTVVVAAGVGAVRSVVRPDSSLVPETAVAIEDTTRRDAEVDDLPDDRDPPVGRDADSTPGGGDQPSPDGAPGAGSGPPPHGPSSDPDGGSGTATTVATSDQLANTPAEPAGPGQPPTSAPSSSPIAPAPSGVPGGGDAPGAPGPPNPPSEPAVPGEDGGHPGQGHPGGSPDAGQGGGDAGQGGGDAGQGAGDPGQGAGTPGGGNPGQGGGTPGGGNPGQGGGNPGQGGGNPGQGGGNPGGGNPGQGGGNPGQGGGNPGGTPGQGEGNPGQGDPPPATPQTQTIATVGGTVSVRFQPGDVTVDVATPNPGFAVAVTRRGAARVRIDFDDGTQLIRVEAWWANGPQHSVSA